MSYKAGEKNIFSDFREPSMQFILMTIELDIVYRSWRSWREIWRTLEK